MLLEIYENFRLYVRVYAEGSFCTADSDSLINCSLWDTNHHTVFCKEMDPAQKYHVGIERDRLFCSTERQVLCWLLPVDRAEDTESDDSCSQDVVLCPLSQASDFDGTRKGIAQPHHINHHFSTYS